MLIELVRRSKSRTPADTPPPQGVAEPLSIFVDSYGSVKQGLTDADLTKIILSNWDLRPGMIVKELGLQRPIYGVSEYCFDPLQSNATGINSQIKHPATGTSETRRSLGSRPSSSSSERRSRKRPP